MIGKYFINEAINKAIETYLKYKDTPLDDKFYDFPVMVIRTLVFIYGELDIINPYITHNEKNMGGFDSNITKYGFEEQKLDDFKNLFTVFENMRDETPNYALINLEKYLIDMYFCKQKSMNLNKEDEEEFKTYLYLDTNYNAFIQGDINKYIDNKKELTQYYNSISYQCFHAFTIEEVRRCVLINDAYLTLGYNIEQVNNLNDNDLRNLNNQIYNFFKVDVNDENKDDLLVKAVNYYKKYGNRITSGNGFIDFLLFASVIATAVFIVILFTFRIL